MYGYQGEEEGVGRIGGLELTYIHLLFSHKVVSNSLPSHGLQHTRPPCPSPSPGVHPSSCPLNQCYHPTRNSTPGYISRKNKNTKSKRLMYPNVHRGNPSISRWFDNEDVVYIHHGILLSCFFKKRNFAICNNMNGLGQHYTKWNKSDKYRQTQ